MIALLIGSALAADFGLALGAEASTNDPFLNRAGPSIALDVRAAPSLALAWQAAWYPLGWHDTTWLADTVVEGGLSPDLSRLRARSELVLRVTPLSYGPAEGLHSRVGAYAGLGWVLTRDDLEAIQAVGDAVAESTQDQFHPSSVWGLLGEVRGPTLGFRVRAESLLFIETVYGTTVEYKHHRTLGGEVTLWL